MGDPGKPPYTGGEMKGFYPVCQVTELAAGYRDTTSRTSVGAMSTLTR